MMAFAQKPKNTTSMNCVCSSPLKLRELTAMPKLAPVLSPASNLRGSRVMLPVQVPLASAANFGLLSFFVPCAISFSLSLRFPCGTLTNVSQRKQAYHMFA